MAGARKAIPAPVVRRIPKYLTVVQELRRQGEQWISSAVLAEALGVTSSTVRQDLSHVEVSGFSKRGYPAQRLEEALLRRLGGGLPRRVVVVGAGNLGCALVRHEPFREHGFHICGVFDANARVVGKRVGRLVVQPMSALGGWVKRWGVEIGMLAVPLRAAQEVADQLIAAGVRGLLNLSGARLRVPERVKVVDARVLDSLRELSCLLCASGAARGDRK